jgi:glycosyltransferase involved in cell wall biosynthesis
MDHVQPHDEHIAALFREQIPLTGQGRKLAVIIPCVPHPTDGASVVVYFWYAYALRQAGYQILNILLLSSADDLPKVADYRRRLEEDGNFQIVPIVCTNPITYSKWAGAQDISGALARDIALQVNEFAPDTLVCFDLLSAWAAFLCRVPSKLAWLGDLHFQSFWHNGIYALERRDYRNALINFLYSHPWRKCYIMALRDFTNVIVSSGSSVQQLTSLGLKSEYLPYPWPAELGTVRAPPAIPTLAFFGTLGALGSLSATRILVKEIHPKLIRKFGRGNFRIRIFGRGALPSFATKIIAENVEFEALGFVPDLNHVLSGCHALIAPIEAPVGNRSRILTALANGLPVIAHTNTTFGNPDLISGTNCCLGRTADEMLDHFYKLLDDHQYADSIARNGRQLYLDKFHPLVACKALLQRIASAAAGH